MSNKTPTGDPTTSSTLGPFPRIATDVFAYGAPSSPWEPPIIPPAIDPVIIPSTPRTPEQEAEDRRRFREYLDRLPPPNPPITRGEFQQAVESIRAALRELEAKVTPPTLEMVQKENGRLGDIIHKERTRADGAELALGVALDEVADMKDKARRLKGWRVRCEFFGYPGQNRPKEWMDWQLARSLVVLRDARYRANQLRSDPDYRNVRVMRVYRKAK